MKQIVLIFIVALLFGVQTTGCADNAKPQNITAQQLESIIAARVENVLPAKVDSVLQNMPVVEQMETMDTRMSDLETSKSIIYIFLFVSLLLNAFFLFREFSGRRIQKSKNSKSNAGKVQSHTKEEEPTVAAENKSVESAPKKEEEPAPKKDAVTVAEEPVVVQEVQPTSLPKEVKPTVKAKTVKYGTFELLENGELRTSDRRLTDDASLQWFKIIYYDDSDTATYTVNPGKKQEIISDVQTFQYYVEPFSVIGTPRDIRIEREGKLRRNGKFWIVTEKLKVNFI